MKIGNLEVYGIIYKIENLINSKVYIGQTIQGFDKRYNCGGIGIERVYKFHKNNKINNYFYNAHLLKSIEKYGLDNFEVIEIFDIAFSKEELDIKEKCWISIYNSINPQFGYNKVDGGSVGGSPSIETRKKISKSLKGVNVGKNPFEKMTEEEKRIRLIKWHNTVNNQSEEFKNRLHEIRSNNVKGKKNYFYGKSFSRGNSPSAKKVILLNNKQVFDCILDASDCFGFNKHTIIKCCKKVHKRGGKLKDGTKLVWMYYEEYLKMTKEEIEQYMKDLEVKQFNKIFKNNKERMNNNGENNS